jgi:O-antigen ligase
MATINGSASYRRGPAWSGLTVRGQANEESLKSLGTRCLLVGLLAGIFALRLKYLVLAALATSGLVFVFLSCVRPLHRVAIVVLINYGYWLVSGAITGGLGWSSFTSGEFWRGEGRCFFYFLPLLAIPLMRMGRNELRFIVKLVALLTLLGALLCGLWLAGAGHLFQAEENAETGELVESTYYIGLMTSHTGAGAFWATVTAFLLAYSLRARDRRMQALAVVAALLTLGTGGRAATLGVLGVLLWLVLSGDLLKVRTLRIALPAAVPIVAGAWMIGTAVPEVGERMTEIVSSRAVSTLIARAEEPTLHEAAGHFYSGADLEHHNLVIRQYLWKYAHYLFMKSPVMGIGFGRFNDPYLQFAGIPHVAEMAVGGEKFFGSGIRWEQQQYMTSVGNAHNSYLHMLAETGLVGLALFMFLWLLIYQYCQPWHHGETGASGQFEAAYCHGCRAMVVCLLVTALAGHALAAPSGGILLTTMVGAWLAYVPAGQRR